MSGERPRTTGPQDHGLLKWLARFLPERLRASESLDVDARRELWANVAETDPCLRAVNERLQETMLAEFLVVIDPQRPDLERLRACDGLRVCYHQLHFIERERAEAREWKLEREAQSAQKRGDRR